MRRTASLLALLLACTGAMVMTAGVWAGPAHAIVDRDCGDFNTQAAAQDFYIDNGGPQSDPHNLDDDNDGVACESNPCPCSTGGGGGGGGGGGTPPKKFHTINLRVDKVSGNFKILGKVPTYRGKFQILRKVDGGRFKFYTRTKAVNPGGKVRIQVKGPKVSCFKVSVPATSRYKLTTKEVGCIR